MLITPTIHTIRTLTRFMLHNLVVQSRSTIFLSVWVYLSRTEHALSLPIYLAMKDRSSAV